jgi:flagellar biosynthesis/type III secretory pathway protein FliH
MPIQIDIRKTLFYKWGEQKGFEKGKQEGLKEGEQRGIVKGLKEGILGIIQVKFGSQKAKLIKNLLDRVNDINRLEKIKKEVIKAKTWDDFIKVFKNSISKNKNSKAK